MAGPAFLGGPGGAGEPGPAGAAGAAGPAGVNWIGPWSVATAYAQRDGVTWAGSSYVATGAVAAGGAPPAANASWLRITQGGGEIAYAENLTNAMLNPVPAAADTDLPGLQIVVPAASGAHTVEARVPMVQINTNAGVVVGELVVVHMMIVDEGGIEVAMDSWEQVINLASTGKPHQKSMFAKRRLPNNAAQKSYKAQMFLQSNNAGHETVTAWSGPGNETPANSRTNFDFTPAYIQARAA